MLSSIPPAPAATIAAAIADPRAYIAANTSLSDDAESIGKEFERLFSSPETLDLVPYLNHTDYSTKPDGSLVRYRCMVQDNGFSPQLLAKSFIMKNSKTDEKREFSLLFSDNVDTAVAAGITDKACIADWKHLPEESFFGDTRKNLVQRVPTICVPVPGENAWVKNDVYNMSLTPSSKDADDTVFPGSVSGAAEKPQKVDSIVQWKMKKGDTEMPVIVMTYNDSYDGPLLNCIYEVVGILQHPSDDVISNDDTDDFMNEDIAAFSMLPTIHCLFLKQVDSYVKPAKKLSSEEIVAASDDAVQFLKSHVMGDVLAAEYLLAHLLSKMRYRSDGVHAGYMPLNLTNITDQDVAVSIFNAVSQLIPRSTRIEASLNALNSVRLSPGVLSTPIDSKATTSTDAAANTTKPTPVGLPNGELQLVDGSWVVVDEVGMKPGKLGELGVTNIKQLTALIDGATVTYSQGFQAWERPVDFGVLVLSWAKCMLPIKLVVPVVPDADVLDETDSAEDLNLGSVRTMLMQLRSNDTYSITDEMHETVTQFFSSRRKEDNKYTPEMFSMRLDIARALSLLSGATELTQSAWDRAGKLETERLRRIDVGAGTPSVIVAESISALSISDVQR